MRTQKALSCLCQYVTTTYRVLSKGQSNTPMKLLKSKSSVLCNGTIKSPPSSQLQTSFVGWGYACLAVWLSVWVTVVEQQKAKKGLKPAILSSCGQGNVTLDFQTAARSRHYQNNLRGIPKDTPQSFCVTWNTFSGGKKSSGCQGEVGMPLFRVTKKTLERCSVVHFLMCVRVRPCVCVCASPAVWWVCVCLHLIPPSRFSLLRNRFSARTV